VKFFFDNHSLDADLRELRKNGAPVAVEPQVFDLLRYLIENRHRIVTKDDLIAGVWNGRIVSDSTLTSRINAARKAIGDSGETQRLIRTIARKGIRFVGTMQDGAPQPAAGAGAAPTLRQTINFCTAPDGVRLAYAEVGHGPPLVRTGHWLTHLEYDFESPVWRPFLTALAADHRLVRYDARGNGLSDWEVPEVSFEAMLSDLETVVDAAGLKRFPLLGMSQGCAVSIAYAVRHPERVSHLVLYGGFVLGRRLRSAQDVAGSEAMLTLMRQGWGRDNPAFRQMFTSLFVPGASLEQMQWYNELQRRTTSGDNAVRLRAVSDEFDVTALLPQVRTPTLVLHLRDDAVQPFEQGRLLAAGIPGAEFVALEGRNHIVLEGDPGWQRMLDEVRRFVRN
jgi:DNA-binding winged helix-turn-helix (wHTH) protein/pimeloyl-ACP methyl ester carboxylesterase